MGKRSRKCCVCEISYPLHPLPPACIQPTQVEYSCLLSFFIYQPEDVQCKRPKQCSCSLCNKLYTYLYHHIVVLDKYIHSNLVFTVRPNCCVFKHTYRMAITMGVHMSTVLKYIAVFCALTPCGVAGFYRRFMPSLFLKVELTRSPKRQY